MQSGASVGMKMITFRMPIGLIKEARFHAWGRKVNLSQYVRLAVETQNAIDGGLSEEEVRDWRVLRDREIRKQARAQMAQWQRECRARKKQREQQTNNGGQNAEEETAQQGREEVRVIELSEAAGGGKPAEGHNLKQEMVNED